MSSLRLALKQSLADAPGGGSDGGGNGDNSSSSSENEASLQELGGNDEDSSEEGEEKEHKAANKIQKTFRNKTSKQAFRTKKKPERKASIAPSSDNDESDDEDDENDTPAKTVPAPDEHVREHMRGLELDLIRANAKPGLRVKVYFDHSYWYGGCISAVNKDGSKIRIQYDDGTSEVSRFPDGKTGTDIVVDAVANGDHSGVVLQEARFFSPPQHTKVRDINPTAHNDPQDKNVTTQTSHPQIIVSLPEKKHADDESNFSRGYLDNFKEVKEMKEQHEEAVQKEKIPAVWKPITLPDGNSSEEEGELPELPTVTNKPVKIVKRPIDDIVAPIIDEQVRSSPTEELLSSDNEKAISSSALEEMSLDKLSSLGEEPSKPIKRKRGRPPKNRSDDDVGDIEMESLEATTVIGNAVTGSSSTYQHENKTISHQDIAFTGPGTFIDKDKSKEYESTNTTVKAKIPALKIRMPKSTIDAAFKTKKEITPRSFQECSGSIVDSAREEHQSSLKSMNVIKSDNHSMTVATENVSHGGKGSMHNKNLSPGGKGTMSSKKLSIRIPAQKLKQLQEHHRDIGMGSPGVDASKKNSGKMHTVLNLERSRESVANSLIANNSKDVQSSLVTEQLKESMNVHHSHFKQPKSPKSPNALTTTKKIKKKKLLPVPENDVHVDQSEHQTNPSKTILSDITQHSDTIVVATISTVSEPMVTMPKESQFADADEATLEEKRTDAEDFKKDNSLLSPGLSPESLLNFEGSIRSERRAAQQANERIAAKQDGVLPDETIDVNKMKKKRRKEREFFEGDGEEESQWVQCDKCGKWRIIPSSVVESLPKQWYCSDNIYDPKHSSCDAAEQTAKQVAKERKRAKKRQRMIKAAAAAAATDSNQQEEIKVDTETQEPTVRSPRPPKTPREEPEKPAKTKQSPPVDDAVVEISSESRLKKEKKVLGKKGRSSENIEKLATSAAESSKPRGRGRPRRIPVKESATAPETVTGTQGRPLEDGENLEWVQCEKCNKWRKLAPHISADDLPEIWTCDLNTWNPASASCDAPEDKADGLQDIGVFGMSGAVAGKLTYRNLIYGSTGRKANRPVSERMRAAESLFAVQFDEDEAPTKVLYSDSSAFVSRGGRSFVSTDENQNMSVLDLMSHSQLWQDLRSTNRPFKIPSNASAMLNPTQLASLTYKTMPPEYQQTFKDFLLFVLESGTLTGDDVTKLAKSIDIFSLPKNMRQVQPFCNENVVITTLCELVKEGKVDCVQQIGANWTLKDWNPHYRRADKRQLPHPSTNSILQLSKSQGIHKRASRCMKIAKPWKRAKT